MKILGKVETTNTMLHTIGFVSTAFFDSKNNIVVCSFGVRKATWNT